MFVTTVNESHAVQSNYSRPEIILSRFKTTYLAYIACLPLSPNFLGNEVFIMASNASIRLNHVDVVKSFVKICLGYRNGHIANH